MKTQNLSLASQITASFDALTGPGEAKTVIEVSGTTAEVASRVVEGVLKLLDEHTTLPNETRPIMPFDFEIRYRSMEVCDAILTTAHEYGLRIGTCSHEKSIEDCCVSLARSEQSEMQGPPIRIECINI